MKKRHYKSFQIRKVNGLMNGLRVSLSQIMSRKMSLGQTGRAGVVSGKPMAGLLVGKTNQEKIKNVKSPTASNWNYGKWLMGKSMEEL